MKISSRDVFNSTFWRNLAVIAGGLAMFFLMGYIGVIWAWITKFFGLLTPFFIGFVIAFLLNGLMVFLEKNTFHQIKTRKKRRFWSLSTSMVIFVGLFVVLVSFMIPQLASGLRTLATRLPGYVSTLQSYLDGVAPGFKISIDKVANSINDFLREGGLGKLFSYSGQVASTVVNVFIGLVVAVYLLYNKESYARSTKKVAYAFLPDVWVYRGIKVLRYATQTFTGFFYSKLLDSLAVGVICFVGMIIFGWEYPLLISVIVGITNIIPFFGPFIGAIPAIIILLAVDPWDALWFALFILVLQQFDGNIMGPRIMQNSIGLPAIWVMFAIVVGGGLFGFAGMILGIPVLAMIYDLVKEYIETRNDALNVEKSAN